jgi:hypothetical protein
MQPAWRLGEQPDKRFFNFADETNLNGPALSGDGAGPRAERAG